YGRQYRNLTVVHSCALPICQTAGEQVAALQAEGDDAILCIATPGVDVSALQDSLAELGVTAVIDGGAAENQTGALPVLAAGHALEGVGRLNLIFTQGGGCRVELADPVAAGTLLADRAAWEQYGDGGQQETPAASDAADPEKDTARSEERRVGQEGRAARAA